MDREELKYEYWFANIRKVRSRTKRKLREAMPSARHIYYIEETTLARYVGKEEERNEILNSMKKWNLEGEYRKLEEKNIKFFPYFHTDYPSALRTLLSAPYAVYLKGKTVPKDTLKAAIVGARQCSPYGEHMAAKFGEALAEQNIDIISGLARGVDGAGQRGALNAGGRSYGVLGSGADVCYPKENRGLYEDLQKRGGVLSELPPGTPPLPQHFPARNRIISALSDIVLVIEAKDRSGSLITADQALELGKEVYALPGPVDSSLSRGCNRLIKQGAGILLSPEDLLEELHICSRESIKKKLKNKIMLETSEELVYSRLGFYPKSIGQLAEETHIEISKLINQLVTLEVKGYIQEISKNYYIKKR